MAEWSISPSDASINSSGVASFPSNTGSVAKLYTVTYTDDAGCTGKTTYTVPACPPTPPTPVDCTSYSFSDKSPTQPVAGNTSMVVATSSKSKGQLTVGSKDSWITYVTTDSDSSTYQYKFKAASNTGGSYRTGTIAFSSSDGCEFTASMQQEGRTCQCSDIESSIVYENTYLPTSKQKNLLLFSADTQGCGSISAFCSSTGDDIFEEEGGSLVRVQEVTANREYRVYANVLALPSSAGNLRNCVVNIYTYKSDGTLCKTIAKDFRQDKNINCSNLLSRYSYCYLQGTSHLNTTTGEVQIAGSRSAKDLNKQSVFIIEGTSPSWLSSTSAFRYRLVDDKWEVYGTIYNQYSGVDDRDAEFNQVGYIFDSEIQSNPNRYYTAAELKRMSGTHCGEHTYKVHVIQQGCNCKHAWVGRTYQSSTYSAQTVEVDMSTYHNSCANITAHAKKDTCDWVSFLTLADNRYLRYQLAENTGYTYRSCTVELYLTDAGGNTCTVDFKIEQSAPPLDCSDCDSIKTHIWDNTFYRIGADGSEARCISYDTKLTSLDRCNGHISYTFDDTGITNPIQGIRHIGDESPYAGTMYSYFKADANSDTTKRKMKVIANYRGSVNCTKEFMVEQEATTPTPGTGCTSSSYEYEFSYLPSGRGANINYPIILSVGSSATIIGTLTNSIPSQYADCAFIEVKTAQNVAIPNVEISAKTGGGYNVYATPSPSPLTEDEEATVVIQWYYYNSNGSKVYPSGENSTIYVKVVN